jgi:hypothetical protein
MRRLWWSVIVLAVCVVGIGFYRGWFALSQSSPELGNHRVNINLAVDPDKMKEDAAAVKDETKILTGQGRK